MPLPTSTMGGVGMQTDSPVRTPQAMIITSPGDCATSPFLNGAVTVTKWRGKSKAKVERVVSIV